MKNLVHKHLPTFIGALIFMLFALYNGFPIVNGDSVTYLESGFNLKVPDERPIFYGMFLRLTSMGVTVWTAIFAQSLILSYLCVSFIKSLVPSISNLHIFALLFIISLGTIASWYAGQVLPDVFTPMLFLSIYLYLVQKNSITKSILLLVLIYISIVVHYSHYVIATLFPIALFIINLLFKNTLNIPRAKLLHVLGITLIAWASILGSNLYAGNGFTTSKMSHVFLMGKLNESGVLKNYLDKNCATQNYTICNYKDSLPPVAWEFVWHEDISPAYQNGGLEANKTEYKTIIKDIVTSPRYWPMLAYKSIEATLRQIILLNIDEGEERAWIYFGKGHPVYETIYRNFPSEINQFKVSKQNYKVLNIPFYDDVYVIIFLLSSLIVLFTINDKYKQVAILTYTLLLLFIFINAFATATFGNVLTRLNSRTIWLIPMTNFIFIYLYTRNWIESKRG